MGKEIGSQKNFILVIVLLVGALVVASYFNSDGTGDVVVKRPRSYGDDRASASADGASIAAPQQRINVDPNNIERCIRWEQECGSSVEVSYSGLERYSTLSEAHTATNAKCEAAKTNARNSYAVCVGNLVSRCAPTPPCMPSFRDVENTLNDRCWVYECRHINPTSNGYKYCLIRYDEFGNIIPPKPGDCASYVLNPGDPPVEEHFTCSSRSGGIIRATVVCS